MPRRGATAGDWKRIRSSRCRFDRVVSDPGVEITDPVANRPTELDVLRATTLVTPIRKDGRMLGKHHRCFLGIDKSVLVERVLAGHGP